MAKVCNPDEQKRLTLVPDVVTGHPAANAAFRAILKPVVPDWAALPRITSSTSAGSMPARAIACSIECAASLMPWVLLKAPRAALVSAVRAVDTITASLIIYSVLSSSGLIGIIYAII
jgi:hypothetical protein